MSCYAVLTFSGHKHADRQTDKQSIYIDIMYNINVKKVLIHFNQMNLQRSHVIPPAQL